MDNKVYLPEFEIHTTPMEEIYMDSCTIDILVDDVKEKRFKIRAKPYQLCRMTTIDCISAEDYYNEYCYRDGRYHRHILQIIDSQLIRSLKLQLVDKNAIFLDTSTHYVLLLQDILIDIVATNLIVIGDLNLL